MPVSEAIAMMLILTDSALGLVQLAAKIQTIVQTAQSEGRDLTDEEAQTIRATRQAAYDRLMATP